MHILADVKLLPQKCVVLKHEFSIDRCHSILLLNPVQSVAPKIVPNHAHVCPPKITFQNTLMEIK